jgi:glycosyltransferase involved in cell wall biosynthesis
MSDAACEGCLPDPGYRGRLLALTRARRDALRGARLVALSRYVAGELEAAGLPAAEVLPPWVEASSLPTEAGEGFVLGGRLVRHKGVDLAVEAWRRAGVDAPLRVAGEGPAQAGLEAAERLGWLDAAALRGLLRRSRALLFPSLWQEPFGILGVESLAQGTPVVVAATGGTEEWSDRGCIRVRPGDLDAMAEAIRRLAGDLDLARGLGEEGRETVRGRFSRERTEARLAALYGRA